MSFGISILQSNGQTFDSTTAPGSIVDLFTAGANTSGSKAYPNLVGFNLFTGTCAAPSSGTAGQGLYMAVTSISYPSGIPTVSWSPGAGTYGIYVATQIIVFAI